MLKLHHISLLDFFLEQLQERDENDTHILDRILPTPDDRGSRLTDSDLADLEISKAIQFIATDQVSQN